MNRLGPTNQNCGNFTFLEGVYEREGVPPEISFGEAYQINVKTVETVTADIAGALRLRDDLPILDVPDPNERLPSIPLRSEARTDTSSSFPKKLLSVFSPHRVDRENEEFLGSLTLTPAFSRRDLDGVDIEEVRLSRPLSWSSTSSHPKRLYADPDVIPRGMNGAEITSILSSYLLDPEAMNFIKLVGAYFSKIKKDRLTILPRPE